MAEEDMRVRVLPTGEYGTLVHYSPVESHCLVELDGWQFGRRRGDKDRADEPWYNLAFNQPELRSCPISQVERLTEVSPFERHLVLEGFETLALVSHSFHGRGSCPVVVIRRTGKTIDVTVRSLDRKIDERRLLEGDAVERLVSAVLSTHVDEWTKTFEPDTPVLDGYSWDMTVYSGSRYFECHGDNAAPREMGNLLHAVADAGLPLAWNGGEISFANGEGAGE